MKCFLFRFVFDLHDKDPVRVIFNRALVAHVSCPDCFVYALTQAARTTR